LGLLLDLDVQSPHQVPRPAHGAVQNVALVRSFLLLLDGQAHRDIAGGGPATIAASE
ncbi:hypothetical protein PHISCL_11208, partial [Aspergillus sclerotialis]